ncbi:MAG: hypothetical protein ACJAS4_001270 [Bacteriovoracaceae bacterium]|jgi:hypothetical protein
MNKILKSYYQKEINSGEKFYLAGDFKEAFLHFERAHILGQSYIIPHTISHLWMLKIGIKNSDFKEIFGQILRIPLGILGSAVGIIPVGNTGGSNVSVTARMELPSDLLEILKSSS